MIPAFDVDGILVDVSGLYIEAWCEAGITVNGRAPQKSDITEWDFRLIPGISDPELAHEIAVDEVFSDPRLYDGFAPMPGVLDGLHELRSSGHRVIAISHPTIGHADSKLRFLKALGFEPKDVFLASDKNAIAWDILVDDGPHHALDAIRAGRTVIVLRQPWNAHRTSLDDVRVDDWSAIVRKILVADASKSPCMVAHDLVHGDRGADYGHPIHDFRAVTAVASALGFRRLPQDGESCGRCKPLGPQDHLPYLQAIKLSREWHRPKADNAVDGCGYWETHSMVRERLDDAG